jgi:hypothetical protein
MRPGWNEIKVPINMLVIAPKNRNMDITDILGLRLFVVKPENDLSFYVDTVRLEE